MPRRKKQVEEEEDIPPETDPLSDDEMEEDNEEGVEESEEMQEEEEDQIEEEDPLEGDEDEDEMDQQAMTIAQKLLVQKKQGVMSQTDVYRTYYTQEKKTSPYITKFERAKILSIRAQAIENGAIPFVPIDDPNEDPYSIAKREYDICKIPYFIVRTSPSQTKEYWRLSDFESLVPLTSM